MRYFLIFYVIQGRHGEITMTSEGYPNRIDIDYLIASKSSVDRNDIILTAAPTEISEADYIRYTA